jgi:hypothetical protein
MAAGARQEGGEPPAHVVRAAGGTGGRGAIGAHELLEGLAAGLALVGVERHGASMTRRLAGDPGG